MSGSSAQGDDLVVQAGNVGIGLTTPSDYYAPNLVVSAAAIGSANTAKVRVYATNYNVLRVMSGMGGLAYSN